MSATKSNNPSTWWKEITNFQKLSSDLYTIVNTQKKGQKKKLNKRRVKGHEKCNI